MTCWRVAVFFFFFSISVLFLSDLPVFSFVLITLLTHMQCPNTPIGYQVIDIHALLHFLTICSTIDPLTIKPACGTSQRKCCPASGARPPEAGVTALIDEPGVAVTASLSRSPSLCAFLSPAEWCWSSFMPLRMSHLCLQVTETFGSQLHSVLQLLLLVNYKNTNRWLVAIFNPFHPGQI